MQVGSCDITELVQVGTGRANPADAMIYNSFIKASNTYIPAGAVINGMYKAFGIDPVGQPGIYACPKDWEAVVIDRRTDWQLEKRLGMIAAALLLIYLFLRNKK